MPNPEYQRLLRCTPRRAARSGCPAADPGRRVAALLGDLDDADPARRGPQPGRPRSRRARRGLRRIDDTRPTVIFAYTVKGYGLATEGHPQNHSVAAHRRRSCATRRAARHDADEPWAPFPDGATRGRLCAQTAERLRRAPAPRPRRPRSPPTSAARRRGTATTQAALGRTLLDLTREAPEAAAAWSPSARTSAPATNLGGWVNKVGVWSPTSGVDWFADDAETILHWRERPPASTSSSASPRPTWSACSASSAPPGAAGAAAAADRRALRPVRRAGAGAVVVRHLRGRPVDPGRHALRGHPRPEGGAHQSITTPSIGLEQPGCVSYEPAFAIDVEWSLLAALARLGRPDGRSAYLRLSTRPVDQTLAAVPDRPGRPGTAPPPGRRRRLPAAPRRDGPAVTIAAMGAVVPEALAAAERLATHGIGADVVCVTSPDLLFGRYRPGAADDAPSWILDAASRPPRRAAGDRARRAPAHAGVPRRHHQVPASTSASPGSASPATSGRLPLPRPRRRQHRGRRSRPGVAGCQLASRPAPLHSSGRLAATELEA